MGKVLATSTQLKLALAHVADLEKKLADATASKDRHYREMQEAQRELEQVHAILDAIPHAPARAFTPEGAYSETRRQTPARLAAYFAVRN